MKRRRAMVALGCAALASPILFSCKGGKSKMKKEIIYTDEAPAAVGAYSQAVKAGNTIYFSGQIAIDPETGDLNKGSVTEQTRLVLKNLKAVIEESDCSLENVVKCTVFLEDMNDFSKMNEVYGEFFKPPYPARAAVQVARLPKDVKVEIEAIAVK